MLHHDIGDNRVQSVKIWNLFRFYILSIMIIQIAALVYPPWLLLTTSTSTSTTPSTHIAEDSLVPAIRFSPRPVPLTYAILCNIYVNDNMRPGNEPNRVHWLFSGWGYQNVDASCFKLAANIHLNITWSGHSYCEYTKYNPITILLHVVSFLFH